MKVGHDLDTAVTKGSLVSIREQYNIPIEYGLHIPQPGSAELLPTIKVGRLAIFLSVVRIGDSGLTGWRTRSEPTASIEELEMPIESAEEVVSPIFHHPRSMKDLCGTKVRKDDAWYYALYMSDLTHQDPDKEMEVRWEKLKNSTKIWNDPSVAEEFERGLLHPQLMRELYTLPSEVLLARATKEMVLLITFMDYRITSLQQEIDALKSGGGPKEVVATEERAFELEKELEKMRHEQDEML
ncbi:hypothetical protein BHE74_00013261 [Ensete ventricosum]|nr:hypothetical protein BHE74_00013261 [Ensete ventricosum]